MGGAGKRQQEAHKGVIGEEERKKDTVIDGPTSQQEPR